MYPQSDLPKPLRPAEFYLLLALSHTEAHGYALKAMIRNTSLGSVVVPDNKIYNLISKLADEALIDPVGKQPTNKSNTPRMHYAITQHGILRLKEELIRLGHAVKIGNNAGLRGDTVPTDIQRLLLNSKPESEA